MLTALWRNETRRLIIQAVEAELLQVHKEQSLPCARNTPIISVTQLVKHLQGIQRLDISAAVVLTYDDGITLDWLGYQHPEFGWQQSFRNILRDHFAGALPQEMMTSFTIACPAARQYIDQGCYGGAVLSTFSWWLAAAYNGEWAIENHSWNHWHVSLPYLSPQASLWGSFTALIITYRPASKYCTPVALLTPSWRQQAKR